jgi:hypothetical protein
MEKKETQRPQSRGDQVPLLTSLLIEVPQIEVPQKL